MSLCWTTGPFGLDDLVHSYIRTCSYVHILRNVEYSILLVMSELSTVWCDRALGLCIAGTRASSVDGEFRPGGSCGVHSWIEGASGDGRRVSWFAPQNQGGG